MLGQELPSLPAFIPMIDTKDFDDLRKAANWGAYGIGLRRVVSDRTYDILPGFRDTTAAEALGVGEDCKTVLVGYGKDPLVEGFWTRRLSLIERLARHKWDLVLSPNYSAYGNFPRFEQLLNFRRNLLIAQEMIEAGIPAVPNIYSFALEDLERYGEWMSRFQPAGISCNLQTQRSDSDFHELVLPALAYLAATKPPTTRFFAIGSSRADRIEILKELFGSQLVLISQNPIQFARHGAVMTSQGRATQKARVPDAFAANVRFYADLVEAS